MVYLTKSSMHYLAIVKFNGRGNFSSKASSTQGRGFIAEYQTALKNIMCMQDSVDDITVFFKVLWRTNKSHLHAINTFCWYSDSMLHTRENNMTFCQIDFQQ